MNRPLDVDLCFTIKCKSIILPDQLPLSGFLTACSGFAGGDGILQSHQQ